MLTSPGILTPVATSTVAAQTRTTISQASALRMTFLITPQRIPGKQFAAKPAALQTETLPGRAGSPES